MSFNFIPTTEKWDLRFARLAKEISTWSKDPSTKIGAIIVDSNRRILGTGYNGFPSRIADDERLENRQEKYSIIIHAEMNALLNCLKNGVSVNGATIYVYGLPPCSECSKTLIQAGIERVVMSYETLPEHWAGSCGNSLKFFKEAKIHLNEVIL